MFFHQLVLYYFFQDLQYIPWVFVSNLLDVSKNAAIPIVLPAITVFAPDWTKSEAVDGFEYVSFMLCCPINASGKPDLIVLTIFSKIGFVYNVVAFFSKI